MSAVSEAAAAIAAAAGTVPGVRVYTDPTAAMDPPGVVVGPPRLYWDVLAPVPTRAVFSVYVVTSADDTMMTRLWELVPAVAEALSLSGTFGVDENGAEPTTWTAGGSSLPAYEISITADLGG